MRRVILWSRLKFKRSLETLRIHRVEGCMQRPTCIESHDLFPQAHACADRVDDDVHVLKFMVDFVDLKLKLVGENHKLWIMELVNIS